MEENIYEVLSRHFFGQITDEEKLLVEKFQSAHPHEYAALKALCEEKEITIKSFDVGMAWKNVMNKAIANHPHKTKTIPIFSQFRKLAAAVAVLIISSLSVYYIIQNTHQDMKITTMKGENQEVMLSDGSIVWLNDSASLSYPEQFSDDERVVELKGEGFFNISRDPAKPFTILTGNADIKVLGTSFNVHASDIDTEVSVKTGTVKVTSNISSSQVTISEGYSAYVQNEKVISFITNNPNYDAWNTGIFQFDNAPMQKVAEDLNTFYDKKINLMAKNLDCGFTAKFNNQKLDEILEILQLTCDISVVETEAGYNILQSAN